VVDYREDLQNLKNHYRDVYEDVDTIRLEPFEEGLPRALLEIGWRSHRRQILGAVEVLVQLAVESIALDARRANPALFGSRELRSRFRRMLSDSLGILVSLSVNSVSPSLLRLAADTRPGVQPITARALAGWYQHSRSSRLFDLLDEWQRQNDHGLVAVASASGTRLQAADFLTHPRETLDLCNKTRQFQRGSR